MPFWTMVGLGKGKATTQWPNNPNASTGTSGIVGMPEATGERCDEAAHKSASLCPTNAIGIEQDQLSIDYGKCVNCQLCVDIHHSRSLRRSSSWSVGARHREDLEQLSHPSMISHRLNERLKRPFRKSLHIRHVDAGSCNGCESELQALHNPFFNLERMGVFFTPSPRHADVLLVTGSVTLAMKEPLLRAYDAMPEPKWVIAMGTCAVSGGMYESSYSTFNGVSDILPVDFFLPGCAPNPAAMIEALLQFLEIMSIKKERLGD